MQQLEYGIHALDDTKMLKQNSRSIFGFTNILEISMYKMCKTCTFFYEDLDEIEFKRYNCLCMDTYTYPEHVCLLYREKVHLDEDVKA